MDRYQRVEKPRPEETINENEIRITAQGLVRNYITYATTLLQEKEVREIVLKAMGQAISKTVAIAEIIKKRVHGLYQDTSISSMSITDVWEPIEEGLVPLEMTRQVSLISITLSTEELNKNSPGFQAPSYVDLPETEQQFQLQPKQVLGHGANGVPYGRGQNRGRGRGRGWSRGGYGNYQENGGYWNYGYGRGGGRARGGGRGRGRGWGSRGAGYERGRVYSRGRGWMGSRRRDRGN